MTSEEFDALMPEAVRDHNRYELIKGVLVVTPPPGNAELDPNQELGYLLLNYQRQHPRGSIVDLTLNEQTLPVAQNRRRCDRAIWTGLGRSPDPDTDVPTVVIEFVSRSRRDQRRDYEAKLKEYLSIGVAEYWVFDRFKRTMTVFRDHAGATVERVVSETESYETELLPGFILPLSQLLGRSDVWRKPRRPNPRRKPPAGGGA
jgi:Uma2 family endonuclease